LYSIPATVQPPMVTAPLRPTMPVESEDVDIDDPIDDIMVGVTTFDPLTAPPKPQDPTVPFWVVEVKPEPLGGWGMVNKYVVYPPIAIEARQEGRVVVEALIGKDGSVKDVKLLAGLPGTGLDEAAISAVYQTPFSPAYQRDKPVLVWVNIPIEFKLR